MHLRFLGKDSTPTNSPTLYAADRDSYVVQGWIVTDPAVLAGLDITDTETVVEVPPRLLQFLRLDGLDGHVTNPVSPIVRVLENGNYVMQGRRVADAAVLDQMTIPDHETCIQIPKSSMRRILVET